MPSEPVSKESRGRRLELLIIYLVSVVFLAALGVLWCQQKGYFTSAPVVEHAPGDVAQKPIELNTARWPELTLIRGIGEVRARAIVEWRESIGGFDNIDQVKDVPGIPDTVVDEMRDEVTVTPREKKKTKGRKR